MLAAVSYTHLLKVHRVEIASARVSDGERDAVRALCEWGQATGNLNKLEVLGFLDNGKSIQWIKDVGAKVVNILSKGSEKHCRLQLKQTPEEHAENIRREVARAVDAGLEVNLYLEDWSNGMKNSPSYVFNLMNAIMDLPIKRFLLPDTLGILNPYDTLAFMHKMTTRYPSLHLSLIHICHATLSCRLSNRRRIPLCLSSLSQILRASSAMTLLQHISDET